MTTNQITAAARAMDELGVDVASTEELASAAIGKLREGAVARCKAMHYQRYGAECSDWDAEGFIKAVIGPKEQQ